MYQVQYGRSLLGGRVNIPPSKSAAHRALLCAALAGGKSRLGNMAASEDISATMGAMRALGAYANFDRDSQEVVVEPGAPVLRGEVDCRESGYTSFDIRRLFISTQATHTSITKKTSQHPF